MMISSATKSSGEEFAGEPVVGNRPDSVIFRPRTPDWPDLGRPKN